MRMKKLIVPILLSAAVIASACGGGGDDADADQVAVPDTVAPTAPTSTTNATTPPETTTAPTVSPQVTRPAPPSTLVSLDSVGLPFAFPLPDGWSWDEFDSVVGFEAKPPVAGSVLSIGIREIREDAPQNAATIVRSIIDDSAGAFAELEGAPRPVGFERTLLMETVTAYDVSDFVEGLVMELWVSEPGTTTFIAVAREGDTAYIVYIEATDWAEGERYVELLEMIGPSSEGVPLS